MVDYVQNVDFGDKDALTPGDPLKRIRGTEMDAELDEIATAIASKENTANKNQNSGYAGLDVNGKLAVAILPAATESAIGAVELATTAEVVTGTDTTRAVTAAGVEAWAAQNAGMVQDISNLSDPNADRILFWDDSAGAVVGMTVGAGLSIVGGTTLALDHLGIEDLSDPGGDRIMFWDDSAGFVTWLTVGEGLQISGTTLSLDDTSAPSLTSYDLTSAGVLNLTAGSTMHLLATTSVTIEGGDINIVGADLIIDANSFRLDTPVAATASAGAASLPANPVGFLTINIAGTNRKVPYYAT